MDSPYVRICYGLRGRVHNFLLKTQRIKRKTNEGGKQFYGMERKTMTINQKRVKVAEEK